MNEKEKLFCEEFINNMSDEDIMYLYHVTGKGVGDLICENGLLLSENRLSSTTIPIDKEILADPIKFIEEEHDDNIRETEEIVLIGCPKNKIADLIIENEHNFDSWTEEENCDYMISPNYVLGYIDMNSLEFTYNDNYDYNNYKVL